MNGSGSASAAAPAHRPVMLAQVLAALAPRDGAIYVDGTFGAGGYAGGLLDSASCTVWGIDRDPDALARGARLAARSGGRLTLVHGRFGAMDALLAARGIRAVDGVALDVGVSSMQLDDAARGFSFRLDGPLDMRMDRTGPSAADLVNGADTEELARIIRRFGGILWRNIVRGPGRARRPGSSNRGLDLPRVGSPTQIVRGLCLPEVIEDLAPPPCGFAVRTFASQNIDAVMMDLAGPSKGLGHTAHDGPL